MKTLSGGEMNLEDLRGKAALVVNVASKCGLTPQYEGLQKLHAKYAERGFSVLGFPCNQFGAQEPGTEDAIAEFCREELRRAVPDVPDVRQARREPDRGAMKMRS